MSARILFGSFFHETHTFLEESTAWEDFMVTRDADILAKQGDGSPTDGFLTTAGELGLTVVPTVDARVFPSGMVEDAALETFWQEFSERARPALAEGIDAIFLVLHGAMVTASLTDPEGELLERIRALPGAGDLPIFGVFDLHANLTERQCRLVNGLVAYRENPHTDARDAAVRATQLMGRALSEGAQLRMTLCRLPIVWAPPGTGTATDPMRALRAAMAEVEATNPAVWAGNVVSGFSFADTPDTGVSLSLVHTGGVETVRDDLERMARLAWELRAKGVVNYPTVDAVLRELSAPTNGPIILVEPSDNIGGGAPGDGTGVLRGLLEHGTPNALVAINDPVAVERLAAISIGDSLTVSIGGKGSPLDPGPVEAAVTLVSRSDGEFQLEDPNSHLASMNGTSIAMGPSAVVRAGGVTILLTSRKTPPFDLGQFRSQGIEPTDFAVIGVKGAVAHRRAYDPIMSATFFVDTPGPCRSDLTAFPWQHLRRPVWPLDDITEPQFQIS
ncbi:MAG: M81 family metallopeptidase [Opitutaceae bacterium]|nr:M81 family metallopeptidase [Opitutaceae bacterium]